MRKLLLGLALSLIIATPVYAYQVVRGDTPYKLWGSSWRTELAKYGISDPRKLPVGLEVNYEPTLGIASLNLVALYEDNLQNTITSADTSLTLVRGTDKSGTAISGTFGFIIDEGTTLEEFVIGTASGTAVTGLQRGISVTDGKTEVAALKKAHRKGASIKMTNYPILERINRQLSGLESLDTFLYMTTSTNLPTTNGQLATKYYVDTVGAGGFTASNIAPNEGLKVFGTSPETAGVYVRADKGMVTSTTGVYQNIKTNGGLVQDSNGLSITTTSLSNAGVATSTPTANMIPIASASGTLNAWTENYFGDGSDGDIVATTSSTLTRDMYYNNFTVNAGVIINTGGYRIFVKGILINNGTIQRNGNAGTNGAVYDAGVGGAALSAGTLAGSLIGKDGGVGGKSDSGSSVVGQPGTNGSTSNSIIKVNSVAGGKGGTATGGGGGAAGGAAGTSSTYSAESSYFSSANSYFVINTINGVQPLRVVYATTTLSVLSSNPSSGGGGGGGGSINNLGVWGGGGGGSGSSAGVVYIAAYNIVNNGVISAIGGNGGNGGNGGAADCAGGGGGGGGNGGLVILIYKNITSGTISISGGTGGVKGTGGNGDQENGTNGNNGAFIKIQI